MRKDWVEDNGWATAEDLSRGLTLSTLCPGPVGSQLATYLGRLRGGALGATAAMAGFILPSFALVVGIASVYGRWGGAPGPRAFFTGAGCAVIAVIAKSALKLTKTMLGRNRSSWAIAGASALIILLAPSLSFLAIVAAAASCAYADSRPSARGAVAPAFAACLALAFMGIKAGLLTFGTGLSIIPVIRAHAVGRGWVTEPQFVDAVSAGMVTPGPIVMAAAFVGYLHAGFAGAVAATLGLFVPVWALTLLLAPLVDRYAADARVRGFARGAMAAAMGGIAAASLVMGAGALASPARAALGAASAVILFLTPVPDPVVILAAGVVGLLTL
jgi:chromate transporter